MVQKDATSNSTQSVIKKSDPKQKYEESYDNFPGVSTVRPRELRARRISYHTHLHSVCVTHIHIQLVSGVVSGEPLQIET